MEKIFIGVRGVDEELFRRFRAWAIQRKLRLSEAFNESMKMTLSKEVEEEFDYGKLNKLMALKPIKVGNKKVRWSEEVDEIVYGTKK